MTLHDQRAGADSVADRARDMVNAGGTAVIGNKEERPRCTYGGADRNSRTAVKLVLGAINPSFTRKAADNYLP